MIGTIILERLEKLNGITLNSGSHEGKPGPTWFTDAEAVA